MCGVKREIGGPNGPHDAHDAGSGGGCRALEMRYKPQQNAQNARCGQCSWLQIPVKCNCGLEHGQPAQRTMSKVIFDGFPWVFDLFCTQSSQNGVPIVQLMFLYEAHARARARASYRNIISTIGTPLWAAFS